VAAARPLRARRRAAGGSAGGVAARTALLRVPASQLVLARRVRVAARARRRPGHRRPPGPALRRPRADDRLDAGASAPRPPRPGGQLQRERAARVGGARAALAAASRCARVLQQRLGGLRGPRREALEATARGVARERWHVSPRPATPPSATTTAPT